MRRFNLVKTIDAIADARAPWFGADERLTLVMLARHANSNGITWPSQRLLADETSRSERTVWAALKTLECEGVVLVVQPGRQHQSTRYSLEHTIERLRAACDAALNELRAAPGATLPIRQSRKPRHPESQTVQSRPAPVAIEGTHEGTHEGTRSVAGATEPLRLAFAEPKTESDHQRVMRHYIATYERVHGNKPEIAAADGAWVKKSLKRRGLEATLTLITNWFADSWRAERQPSLRQIDANAARAATSKRNGVQPSTGATWLPGDQEGA